MPIPRFTTCPGCTSAAARRIICSRVQLTPGPLSRSCSRTTFARARRLGELLAGAARAGGAVLDDVAGLGDPDEAFDVEARQVDLVGVDGPPGDDAVGLDDRHLGG